jgi:AAA+ ATPase superfamily predicted ATPase
MSIKFSKLPKIALWQHAGILIFLICLLTWHWFSWHPFPNVPIWLIIALYAPFFVFMEYRPTKGQIYQAAIARQERKYASFSTNTESKPKISKTAKKVMDFRKYIEDRKNHNLFIAGSSGTGKTTLMRYLIGLFPNSVKTIFSFKARDDYLKLGIPILKVSEHAGDPFSDKEAFVQSFCVTYPMNTQGVTAASIPSILRTTLRTCNTWKELNKAIEAEVQKEKPGSFTHSAFTFIQQKLTDLELKTQTYKVDYEKDTVLDFTGLNESAKTFYGEFYLRQIWHNIEAGQENPMKHIVVIDEAHRLLKSEATIFSEVARLIRARGALWCGTQNYSDLPGFISNQFAMHLLFNTRSKHDIQALEAINYLLPFVVTEMPDHHFTDAATRELHDAIPIFTANIGKFKDHQETYIAPPITEAKEEKPPVKIEDYTGKVLQYIEEEACWTTELAKRIAKEESIEYERAKFAVSKALKALLHDGKVARERINLGDKEVILYYRKDPAMSGLHRFMENQKTKLVGLEGIAYELAKPGEEKADITTANFDIEIETGLKNDLTKLQKKLANVRKRTYIVVPGETDKERYKKAFNNPLIEVLRFDESLEV